MERPKPGLVTNWGALRKGQSVRFYTADGWKKGHVASTYLNSASVVWAQGASTKLTRVYDLRNIQALDS